MTSSLNFLPAVGSDSKCIQRYADNMCLNFVLEWCKFFRLLNCQLLLYERKFGLPFFIILTSFFWSLTCLFLKGFTMRILQEIFTSKNLRAIIFTVSCVCTIFYFKNTKQNTLSWHIEDKILEIDKFEGSRIFLF